MAKLTWIEKRKRPQDHMVKTIEKSFADIPEGSKMLIATPQIIDDYVRKIPSGSGTNLSTLRNDLAIEFHADKTCPVTTGIFLRIVAEAAFEELQSGKPIEDITPFWRVIQTSSKLASKLQCGIEFVRKRRMEEGLAA